MKRVNNHYSLEFKLHAVELSKQKSLQQVANELNISRETLRNWTRGMYLGQSQTKDSVISKPRSKEEEENIKLKKELYEIKLERDILKKALGIFSKSDK